MAVFFCPHFLPYKQVHAAFFQESTMQRTDDLRIREMKELTPPSHLIREFPCTEAASATASGARVALHRILHGQDDRLMVVIGPCSIHDPKAAMEYAARLAPVRERLK